MTDLNFVVEVSFSQSRRLSHDSSSPYLPTPATLPRHQRHKMEMAHTDTPNPVYGYLPKATSGQVSTPTVSYTHLTLPTILLV